MSGLGKQQDTRLNEHKVTILRCIFVSIIIASDPGDLTLSIVLQLFSDPKDLKLRYVKVIVSDSAILIVVVLMLNFVCVT